MNVDDYLYTYFSILKKATELCPTDDKKIVYKLSATDKKFNNIVQKVGQMKMIQQLRQIFVELVKENVIDGTITKQLIIINAVTPLGYSLLKQTQNKSFLEKIKQAAPKWAVNSLTSFLISFLTH